MTVMCRGVQNPCFFRWGNFYDNLEKHWLKMFFRSRSGGRDQSKFGDGTYDDIYLR